MAMPTAPTKKKKPAVQMPTTGLKGFLASSKMMAPTAPAKKTGLRQ